ncbi:MAG: hypothetical protein WBB39_05190, partial [Candidatus Saccharimonadales bacterium]
MSPRTTIRFDEILAKADDIVAAKQAAAEAAAAAQLAELDNDNELLGGQIVQLLRNAFDAALQDDGQPVDKQLAAAKKLHDQLRDMLALLQGGTAPAALTPEQQFVLAALASGRLVVDDKGGIKDRDWGKLHPRPAATPTPLPADPVIPPATSSKPA